MALVASEQFEPFLDKNVVGNILDQVDQYQYNLKLYMIAPLAAPIGAQPSSVNGGNSGPSDAREDKPGNTKNASGQGGYLQNSFVAKPSETVVLAQTGVTGAQIDNLEIVSAMGPGGGIITSEINFDIIQPGAADFMDQIMAAKALLGCPLVANDIPLFLEIVFKGYNGDIEAAENEDAGGEAILAAGPYRYSLVVHKVALEIDDTGSTYAFSCVPHNKGAFLDSSFRMPKKLESIGTTIEEHCADLIKKINEHNVKNYNSYQIQDEIEIDLSGFTEGPNALKDTKLTNTDDQRAEEINRIMNPELEGKTEDEYEDILEDSAKDEGTLDIVVSENKVTVREDVSIERYIATLLSMNDEFFARATRAVKAEAPADTEVRKQQPTIDWFKINGHVEYIEFDYKRNKYAMKTVYKPTIFKTAKNTVQAKSNENSDLSSEDVRARIDGLGIFKAYHYLYTGLNDQIKQCNIKYDTGIALLAAPAGGVSGDFGTVMAKTISNSATPNEDLKGKDIATAAVNSANNADQAAAINKVFDQQTPGREKDIASLGALMGLSGTEIKDAVANRNGANANRMKEVLQRKGTAEALRNAQVNANRTVTTSDNNRNPNTSGYSPTLSGNTYAADIIGSVSERLTNASQLAQTQKLAESLKPKPKDDNKSEDGGPKESVLVQSIPNPAEDGTYNGTPRNTIFGYLMQQHGLADFLVELDIEIKGDPWYLGPPTGDNWANQSGSSIAENQTDNGGLRLEADENYILFDLQTPRLFDFNVEDEDANTGYWSKMGTSYFITGIYQLINIRNTFSGGEFTQDIKLMKQTALDLKKQEQTTKGEE
jgi:hypothetical protein